MEQSAEWTTETVTFEASDGVSLVGDVYTPTGEDAPGLVAVVSHPHPQYGGDRFNPVVAACCERLASSGAAALRFDFRREFGGGVAERADVEAAAALLRERHPQAALGLVGYSFGAMVTLGVDDRRAVAIALIAPPLTAMAVDTTPAVPTLVLTPAHDQFTPPADAGPIVDGWRATNPDVAFETVEMTDHFLAGRLDHVARRSADWLRDTAGRRSEVS